MRLLCDVLRSLSREKRKGGGGDIQAKGIPIGGQHSTPLYTMKMRIYSTGILREGAAFGDR